MMTKVRFFDRRVLDNFLEITFGISATLSLVVLFVDMPIEYKTAYGWIFLGLLFLLYLAIWIRYNCLTNIDINIEGSDVTIKVILLPIKRFIK
jgi:hypothetical protein